jgi:hypothetical protein
MEERDDLLLMFVAEVRTNGVRVMEQTQHMFHDHPFALSEEDIENIAPNVEEFREEVDDVQEVILGSLRFNFCRQGGQLLVADFIAD